MLNSITTNSSAAAPIRHALSIIAAAVAAVACAVAVFMAGAGSALAPDPGRLNSDSPLAATANAWNWATHVDSHEPTYGFYLSSAWTSGYRYQAYAGYPCSRYAQPGGTILAGYIAVSGSLSRCAGV